jgi:hypothetical protein
VSELERTGGILRKEVLRNIAKVTKVSLTACHNSAMTT